MRSIAIDGPAGAGKSSLSKELAKSLGYFYVDTGAIYRTVALKVHQNGVNPTDADSVAALLPTTEITMGYGPDGSQRMYLDGVDVSNEIRIHAVYQLASQVAAITAVREFLLDFQRQQAEAHSVIMDGRDIGTVVLPNASVKIYLTASAQERAKRRLLELQQRGQKADYETVLHDIEQRDFQDMNRAVAPLRQAEDSVLLDTTHLNPEESLVALIEIAKGE